MRLDKAVEIETGQWVYASTSSRGGHPLGYCMDHEDTGHATEVGARECYSRWLRDNLVRAGSSSWTDCNFKGCRNPANRIWEVRSRWLYTAVLCESHDDRDSAILVIGLDRPAGNAWGTG